MNVTVDIPQATLEELMRLTEAKSASEAVGVALSEFLRRRRVQELVAQFGRLDDFMSQEDLQRMRGGLQKRRNRCASPLGTE